MRSELETVMRDLVDIGKLQARSRRRGRNRDCARRCSGRTAAASSAPRAAASDSRGCRSGRSDPCCRAARPSSRSPASSAIFVDLFEAGILGVEVLQVMRRAKNLDRLRGGERRQEIRVRLRPGVADGHLVGNLDDRLLAVDQKLLRRPEARHLRVVRHVLPVEAKILGGERLAVRPFVARAEDGR